MKKSYTYREKNLIKKPFLNIFLKNYNSQYGETKSYAIAQKLQKDQKLVDPYAKEILIFYDPIIDNEEIIKIRIKTIRKNILQTLKDYIKNISAQVATEEEILKHQTATNKESSLEEEKEEDEDHNHDNHQH